ncbi:hypothetical protein MTO96_017618 [Rhipicephalus appendiculatus]
MYGYPVAPTPSMVPPAYGQENVNDMAILANAPSSLPSAGSKEDDAMFAAALVGVVIVLGVIVTAVTVIAFARESNSNDKTTGSKEQLALTEKKAMDASGLTVIVPEIKSTSTPTPLTRKTTTEETTRHVTEAPSTVSKTTHVKTTPTTTAVPTTPSKSESTSKTPGKKDTWRGLICTIGTKLNGSKMFIKDGVCNYLFYDSVYKKGPTPFDPDNVDTSLSIFLANHSKFETTKFGIAFAYKQRQQLLSELSTQDGATPVVVKYFLDRDICNFGILDTPTKDFDKSSVEQMLESLKLLDQFSVTKTSEDRECITVFAGPSADTPLEDVYVEKFSTIFTPSIVVILSHYLEGDNTFEDCRVVPPTMLARPPSLSTNSSYRYDMSTAAETISKMIARRVDASWALSVTMKGRWTKLKGGQSADLLSECVHDPSAESFGSYTEVCEDRSFTEDTQNKLSVYGTLYYNRNDGRMFAFDNDTTFNEKLCRLRAQHLSFAIAVAAYDVDYDDYSNVCAPINPFSEFSRLVNLKYVLDYLEKAFNVAAQLQHCLEQTE